MTMAKISTDRCKGGCTRNQESYRVAVIFWILHTSAFITVVVTLGWNYSHEMDKGPCRRELNETEYEYVTSNLTSAQKEKCEKIMAGITLHILVHEN